MGALGAAPAPQGICRRPACRPMAVTRKQLPPQPIQQQQQLQVVGRRQGVELRPVAAGANPKEPEEAGR